jgi:hypothetical protein
MRTTEVGRSATVEFGGRDQRGATTPQSARHIQRDVDLSPKVSDSAFELGVAEQ